MWPPPWGTATSDSARRSAGGSAPPRCGAQPSARFFGGVRLAFIASRSRTSGTVRCDGPRTLTCCPSSIGLRVLAASSLGPPPTESTIGAYGRYGCAPAWPTIWTWLAACRAIYEALQIMGAHWPGLPSRTASDAWRLRSRAGGVGAQALLTEIYDWLAPGDGGADFRPPGSCT